MNTYISDIKNGTLNRGIGPVLHVWWVGINSMSQIWTDAIKVDSSMSRTDVLENARSRVDQQINELERQLNQVRSEPALNKYVHILYLQTIVGRDLLIRLLIALLPTF